MLYVMPTKCALGADCRRAWQGRAKMPLVCLAGQVLFFAFSDLYECGGIIFPMRMARFVDERNGQAPCAIVGKAAQKVVRRVLPREPKACSTRGNSKRRSLLLLQGMLFEGFLRKRMFSRVLRIGARQAQAYAAAFHGGRQGCSTHGTSKALRAKGRAQNGRLPALSTRSRLVSGHWARYAILQTVLQIVTNCGAALQKKHVAGKYNLQNRKHFNGGASRRLGLQGGKSGARKEEYEGTEHIRSRR